MPRVTVDVVIELPEGIVLIQRANPPLGWALPGGFLDYGESLEAAAVREAREETGLNIALTEQFFTYSEPDRDPRHHTITTVFTATGRGDLRAGDDATDIGVFTKHRLPSPIVFDHADILRDYFRYRSGKFQRRIL